MRKIESAMLAAIASGKSVNLGNTAVQMIPSGWRVTLHGNLIAEKMGDLVQVSLCGWNTPTTRTRLSRIIGTMHSNSWPQGAGVSTRKGQVYLSDSAGCRAIDATGWHKVTP